MEQASRVVLDDFSGGLNTANRAIRLPPNQFNVFQDIRYTPRDIEKRPGYVKFDPAQVKAAEGVRALWLHYADDGTVTYVAVASDGIYEGVGAGWSQRALTMGTYPQAVQFGAYLYILPGGGSDGLYRFKPGELLQCGLSVPVAAPTTAVAGAGVDHTGTYRYRSTYVREETGVAIWEGNPSAASTDLTVSAQKIQISAIPAAFPEAAATHAYIYRFKVGFSKQYEYVGKVAETVTTWDDNVADGGEGAACPGLGYAGTYSHGLPPTGCTSITTDGGYLYLGKGRRLYISNDLQPWSYSAAHYLDLGQRGDTITALTLWNDVPYALMQQHIVGIVPDPGGAVPWRDQTYPVQAEAMAPNGVYATPDAIYWVGASGVYEWAGGRAELITRRISDLFVGNTPANLKLADLKVTRERLWLTLAVGTAYNNTLRVADLRVRTVADGELYPQPAWVAHTAPASVAVLVVGHASLLNTLDSTLFAGSGNAVSWVLRLDTGKSDFLADYSATTTIPMKLRKALLLGGVHQEKSIQRFWPEVYPTNTAGIATMSFKLARNGDFTAAIEKTVAMTGTDTSVPVDVQLEFVMRARHFTLEVSHTAKDEATRPVIAALELESLPAENRP